MLVVVALCAALVAGASQGTVFCLVNIQIFKYFLHFADYTVSLQFDGGLPFCSQCGANGQYPFFIFIPLSLSLV